MLLAWTLFLLYLLGTAYLGWLGLRQTKGFSSYAIGRGDLSPLQVGVTLAAATASAATFIINPGFVYVDGLAAFMHLGLSVYIGFVGMLLLLSFRFRQLGAAAGALTIPDWIGKRYESKNFSLYFAFINLLSFAFIVLLVGGISIVMQKLLGINNLSALVITLVFVTAYVLVGGTYAHVYTNMFQGFLMVGVSLIILASAYWVLGDPTVFLAQLKADRPNLLAWTNPESRFYKDIFSTYIAGFCIGAALVCQPHILTKALYVQSDRDVKRYIVIFSVVYLLFTLLLLTGFLAHAVLEAEQITDPSTGLFRQDVVMTTYLQTVFPPVLFTVISVVLLAAAMSTLDGLFVGIATITANDLVLNLLSRKKQSAAEPSMQLAMRASQIVLVLVAIATFFVTLSPPKLLGIFGQVGVYGLVLAAVPPLLAGVLFDRVHLRLVWFFSVFALCIHFGAYAWGSTLFPASSIVFENPGVTAALAFLGSNLPNLAISWWLANRPNQL